MIKKENGIEFEFLKAEKDCDINLVFIHGSGCNKKFLRPIAEILTDYNRYMIDLPSHGNSDRTGYSFDNYIKAITNFVSGLKNVVLIGHSLGGTLTLKASSLGLENVVGSVVLNGSYAWDDLDKDFMEGIYNGKVDVDWLMKACGNTDNQDVLNSVQSMDPMGSMIADFLIDEAIDVSDCLDKIKIPMLVYTGGEEIIAYPRYAEKIHEAVSSSELVITEEGKHMVGIAQKDKVKEMIYDFIDRRIKPSL